MFAIQHFAGYDPAVDNKLFSNAKGKSGEPSRRQKKKQAKHDRKIEKKQSGAKYLRVSGRVARKEGKGAEKTQRGEAVRILAEQGIVGDIRSGGQKFMDGIKGVAQAVGLSEAPPQEAYEEEYEPAPPSRPPVQMAISPSPLQYQEQQEPEYAPVDNVRMTKEALEARDNALNNPLTGGKNKTMLYVGIAVAVLVIAAIGYKFLKK